VEHDLLAENVIPEAPTAQTEPVLAIPWLHPLKLPDFILAAPIVWIGCEDLFHVALEWFEVRMAFKELLGQPFVVRSGANGKRRCHGLLTPPFRFRSPFSLKFCDEFR